MLTGRPLLRSLFLPRLRLGTRMMVFLGLFLLVLMLAVSVLGVQRDRDLLTQRMEEEGLALARAYALAAENALILKGAGLARVAGEAGQIPEITFLAISGPDGRILAHTEPSHIGEAVTDPLVAQALRTPIGAVEAGRTPAVKRTSPAGGGREVLEVVMPLVILDQVRGVLQIGLGTDLILQAELNTTRSSLLIALAAFLFGVAFIAAFSHSVTRPLTVLARAADQIRPGTWNVPVPASGDGEVGQLAEALERMRQEVWASFVRQREQTAEVEQLKAYAEDILDSLQAGVVSLDLTGRLRGMNRSALALLGLEAAPRPRMLPSEVLAPWPELGEAFEAVAAGEGEVREVVLQSAGRPAANRLLRLHAARLKDRSGTVIGELVVFDDITFLRSMEQRVRDAEKMAAMGELSAGVAHEVRNPLGSIRNAAQFLQQKLEADDPRARFTGLIIGEVDRLNALVSRLLQYTRGGSGGLEVHDLRESLGQALLLAELRAPSSRVKLVRLPEGPVAPVWADPKRIVQLLLNLLFNAIEAIPDRGRVTVLLGTADGRVWLRIADDGVGMPPEVLARLGEPFFTTRDEGTGLGLAIARQIVAEHRGSLRFESEPGRGTTVILEFPVCEQENR